MHVRTGDQVVVVSGRERGKTGRVARVLAGEGRVVVEKLNLVKRHTRPSGTNRQGGIVEKEAPLDASNVRLLCPKCGKGTRAGRRVLEDKSRVRVCRKCGEMLES